jgi:protein-S-isoprenylcysteine O-methyltransferase Ste14
MAAGIKKKAWTAVTVEFLIMGLMLFGAAGTWAWAAGWVWMAIMFGLTLYALSVLINKDPALLEERMKGPIQKGQKGWDKFVLTIFLTLATLWLPLMAIDAVRLHLSNIPIWWQIAGAILTAVSGTGMYVVLTVNTFAAPVVKIQTERAHHVIDTGPYAIVRHPMYAAALLYFPATALLLGSAYGLLLAVVLDLMLVLRTALEDKTLHQELPGYPEYASRVRFRLVPFIW